MKHQNINVIENGIKITLNLGRQGEYNVRDVIFDMSDFQQKYGDGTATIVHYPANGSAYTVPSISGDTKDSAVLDSDNILTWTIGRLATMHDGYGIAEITWLTADGLKKSIRYNTYCKESIGNYGTDRAAQQSYIDQMVELASTITDLSSEFSDAERIAAEISDARENAVSDIETLESNVIGSINNAKSESIEDIGDSKESALDALNTAKQTALSDVESAKQDAETDINAAILIAETHANNASQSATNASNSATSASNSADSASQSATSAQASATNASNSATNASQFADNASSSANSASQSAASAQTSATNASASEQNARQSAEDAQDILDSVQAEGNTQIGRVQAKGDEIIESLPDDFTQVQNDIATLNGSLDSLNHSLALVFSPKNLSFTKYTSVNVDFSEGEYILHVDEIVSEDTDKETSLIIFSYTDSGSVSVQCERNTEIQKDVVFEKAVSKIYVYSSINALTSTGDDATWYGLSIHKSISDKTLSIPNHFADAAITGSKIKKTEDSIGADLIEWTKGYYVNTAQAIGDEVSLSLLSDSGFRCAIVDCEEGDVFYLDGLVGGKNARLRTFIDDDGVKITSCASSLQSTTETLIAPEGASKFILNDNGMVGTAYKGIPPFYYSEIIDDNESDRLNVEFSVYGGVSHPSFIHGSLAINSDGYVENTTYNSRCTQRANKPFSASFGDIFGVQSGYKYTVNKATMDVNGTKTSVVTGWTTNKTTITDNGLYMVIVQREDNNVLHPKEAQEAFYIIHNALNTMHDIFLLQRNPYRNIVWSTIKDITSVSHAHCTNQNQFDTLKSKYDHIALSNYHPSVPFYPLTDYFTDADDVLSSPNAEHAYFTGSNAHVHLNSIGSFLMSDTVKYSGTAADMIFDTLNTLKMHNGGGVTINHPKWSGITKTDMIPMIMTGGVIAMEIYNASCEVSNNQGYSLDIWDSILSEGVQVYGVAVPDHEAQYRPNEDRQPFGYNHMLVINETQDEILSAYRMGHFYTSLLNDGLSLINVNLSSSGLYTIEVSEASTFIFTTATRSVTVSDASTSATFQTTADDVYIRAEAVRGNNRLWTNAIFI